MTNLSEIAGRFKAVRKLGTGGSGDVYLCLDSDGTQTAVKLFSLEGLPPAERDRLGKQKTREARSVATKLTGTRLLDLIDAGFDHDLNRHYIATAFVPGIPLSEWVRENGAPPVEQAVAWALDITEQLSVVHDLEVAHFDVKPANIIIREDNESAQLIDFGEALARNWTRSEQHRTGVRGTFAYMAPEIRSGQQIGWNPGADVFGFGAVLFEMLTGMQAFSDRPGFVSVVNGDTGCEPALDAWHYPPEIPSRSVPEPLRNLCRKCLAADAAQRPRASAVHDILLEFRDRGSEERKENNPWSSIRLRFPHLAMMIVTGVVLAGLMLLVMAGPSLRNVRTTPAAAGNRNGGGKAGREAVGGDQQHPLLETVKPQKLGSGKDAVLGFQLKDAAVFDESLPQFHIRHAPEPSGKYYISRLTYFRTLLFAGKMQRIVHRGQVLITPVPESIDANIWATRRLEDSSLAIVSGRSGDVVSIRPGTPLDDGVYCVHSGPLIAGSPPDVTVPVVIRGYGVPALQNAELVTDGSQVMFRVRIRNEGTGELNRAYCKVSLSDAGSGRWVNGHDRFPEVISIAAGQEHEFVASWSGDELNRGRYRASFQLGDRDYISPETQWFDAVTSQPFRANDNDRIEIDSEPEHRDASVVLTGHEDRVWSVAFHPDGQRLLSASEDGTVRWWDIHSGQEVGRFTQHAANVLSVAVSDDGQTVLSAGFDSDVLLWNLDNQEITQRFRGHASKIWQAVFRPEHREVITAGEDGTLRLWSIESGKELARWPSEADAAHGAVLSVAAGPGGDFCIGGTSAGHLIRWDLTTMSVFAKPELGWIRGIAISPDGRHVLVGRERELRKLAQDNMEGNEVLSHAGDAIFSVALTPDGKRVISGSRDRQVFVSGTDSTQGGVSIRCDGQQDEVLSVAVSQDGRWGAAGAADGTVRIWELPSVP